MQADYIWMNGEIIPWEQATVHVFTHALHYGSSTFEGIRAYEMNGGRGDLSGGRNISSGCSTPAKWPVSPPPSRLTNGWR